MIDSPTPDPRPTPPTDLRQRAVRGGAIYFLGKFGVQIIGWSATLVTARLLDDSDYGMMSAGMLFVGVTDMFAEAGFGKALVQKRDLKPSDVDQCFTLSLVFSIALYALLFLIAGPASHVVREAGEASDEFAGFLRVFGLLTLTIPFRTIPYSLLERDMRLARQSTISILSALSQSMVVLTLAWLGYGYWALAVGSILGRCIELGTLVYFSGWKPRLAWLTRDSAELLKFSFHIGATTLLWFVYQRSDQAVITFLLQDTAVLGQFFLAQQLISIPVDKLSATMNTIMYPVYCRLQTEPERLRSWFLRMTTLLGFVTLPTMFGMMLVADDGIRVVLSEKWEGAIDLMRILSPAGAIMVFAVLIPPMLNALGRPQLNLYYNITQTIVMPISFCAGAYLGGVVGVCWVWLLIYPLIVAGLIEGTKSVTRVGVWDMVLAQWPNIFGVMAMATAVLTTQIVMSDSGRVWRLAASIGVGAATYAAWMLATARHTVLADVRQLMREVRGK